MLSMRRGGGTKGKKRSKSEPLLVFRDNSSTTTALPKPNYSFGHHRQHHTRVRRRYETGTSKTDSAQGLTRENDALRAQLEKQWIDIFQLNEKNSALRAELKILKEQNKRLLENERMAFKAIHEMSTETKLHRGRAKALLRQNRALRKQMVEAADTIEKQLHYTQKSKKESRKEKREIQKALGLTKHKVRYRKQSPPPLPAQQAEIVFVDGVPMVDAFS